jgi:ankyrin repeat protein
MFLQNIKDQPVELILESISHLKYKDIQELCRTNTRINKICKVNKNTIAKYVLQNDYLFTNFPNDIDYTAIMKYIQNINNMFPFPSTNLKKITKWKTNILEWAVSWGRLQVVEFLVKNGVNNLNRSLLDAVKNNNLEIVKILVENGANNLELAIQESSKQNNIQIINFLKSKVALQSGGNVKKPSKPIKKRKSSKQNKAKKSSKMSNVKNINYKVLSDKKKSCIKKKVGIVMNEFKTKKLHSSSGNLITNPKQAIAIALSIAKRNCL